MITKKHALYSPDSAYAKASGFTLIEITLVLVLLAVLSVIAAPSFFSAMGGNLDGEARNLQKMLRMSSEEAQLSGAPIMLLVYADHLELLTANRQHQWQPLRNDVLNARYSLIPPVRIRQAIRDAQGELPPFKLEQKDGEKQSPPLTRLLFQPDGNVSLATLTLDSGEKTASVALRIEPGPAGIAVNDH